MGRPRRRETNKALIEFMTLIYDNSNPIMGSLLSVVCTTAEFNYGQAKGFPAQGTFPVTRWPLPGLLEDLWWSGASAAEGQVWLRQEGRVLQAPCS